MCRRGKADHEVERVEMTKLVRDRLFDGVKDDNVDDGPVRRRNKRSY